MAQEVTKRIVCFKSSKALKDKLSYLISIYLLIWIMTSVIIDFIWGLQIIPISVNETLKSAIQMKYLMLAIILIAGTMVCFVSQLQEITVKVKGD
jgi:hypothetical protein